MGDDWSPYITDCKCGHARASHYWDVRGSGDCLASNCGCKGYKPAINAKAQEPAPYKYEKVSEKDRETDPELPAIKDIDWHLPFMRQLAPAFLAVDIGTKMLETFRSRV